MLQTGGDSASFYLSGKNNFRYDVYPEYKANRDSMQEPRWRQQAKEYVLEKFKAEVSEGCEADDLMGIEQCKSEDTIIASLDKDLLMIPGRHFSWEIRGRSKSGPWVKPSIHRTVSEIDGLRHFYKQCIIGDVADNVKGIPGRGEKYADKLLDSLETEREMFDAVRDAYGFDDAFLMNARCLWIFQKENDDYINRFNTLREDEDNL
jgi:DNA polymerase-1